MRQRVARYRRIAPLALTVASLAGGIVAAGCSSGQPAPTTSTFAGAAQPAGSWAYPNGDLDNTRDAAGSRISSSNVASLKEAWTFKLSGTAATGVTYAGSLAAAPVVVNGVVYLQDLYANVYAISLATGQAEVGVPGERRGEERAWTRRRGGGGRRRLRGHVDRGLRAERGHREGRLERREPAEQRPGGVRDPAAVSGGRVYLASAYGSGPGGGVLLALNAATGKELWSFNTVIGGAAAGVTALGLGSGGAWETPLVGTDGSVTFGTGNPYQSIGEAISHPSRQLYTDSEVNLSAATGKLRWYYQAVPNDFKDYDMQLSPIAATVRGVPAVIGGGKMGYVYAMNASTGALLWKTPVGAHNGHDNDSALLLAHQLTIKLPYTFEPGPLGGVLTNMAVADGSRVPGHDRRAGHREDADLGQRRCRGRRRPPGRSRR